MLYPKKDTSGQINLKKHFVLLAACWSIFIFVALAYDMHVQGHLKRHLAQLQARVAFEKDLLYRKWNAMHGGVYVPVTRDTQPNPYLQIPERDLTTPSGRKLTLINPAYMTRQVFEMGKEFNGVIGHITSLDPMRPENAPDAWERKALQEFEKGVQEVSTYETINGIPYLRLMRPLIATKICLKCHGKGHAIKEGDIRGGISVAVPLAPFNKVEAGHNLVSWIIFLTLWILGIAGLGLNVFKLSRQITARKETEVALNNFKLTLDKVNDCVFMFYPDTLKFFYVNDGTVRNFGYSKEELYSMTPLDLQTNFTEEGFLKLLESLKKGRRPYLSFEAVCRHKNGSLVPVDVILQYVKPSSGDERFVAIVRNISKRKEMEEEKKKLQAELLHSQKLEAIGQLAAGIAHEINTPTQYIGTNIDFLDEAFCDVSKLIDKFMKLLKAAKEDAITPELIDEVEEAIEETDWEYLKEEVPQAICQSREGVARVTSIVRAMKDFSHPGSKEKEPADINKIIDTTITISRNEWKYVADVETDFESDLPPVPCLVDEMGQVILNLLVNAAHAIGEKLKENPELTKGLIKISTRRKDDWVEIRISDTGTGIPEDARDRIFEPFFTTKEVGKGTGQGLAIVRNVVVDKHQGTIDFETEVGKGTTFIIRLPLSQPK